MDDKLRKALARDDDLEDRGMHGDDRRTCYTHQAWAEDCEDLHRPYTADQSLAQVRAIEDARYDRAQAERDR